MRTHRQLFIRLRSTSTDEWFVDPGLRDALIADAEAAGSNMNDVAVRVLAEHFDVDLPATSARSAVRGDNPTVLVLRLPVELERAVAFACLARTPQPSLADEVRRVLSDHYGLPLPARDRRKGGRVAA